MLGKMKLREAVIIDKLDTLKQNWVLPLDPVYKQIVKMWLLNHARVWK